jgi:hypothetical protein
MKGNGKRLVKYDRKESDVKMRNDHSQGKWRSRSNPPPKLHEPLFRPTKVTVAGRSGLDPRVVAPGPPRMIDDSESGC